MPEKYDVVVVGSGFGGAVVAARLAEAGRSVCLMERGRRWSPGEYPRSFSQIRKAVWDPINHAYGFLDYRVFRRMDVIQGAGVGGGSLHYFNVQLRAPEEIFRRPEWPASITRAVLDPYYDRVQEVVESGPLVPPAGETMPARTVAFRDAAARSGYEAELVPIAVHTGPPRTLSGGTSQLPCTFNADCLLGCRAHAKNNLDVTFVPLGEQQGMTLLPLHIAEGVKPGPGGGWTVTARRLNSGGDGSSEPCEVTGTSLVLSAGALGSTELLLHARDIQRTLPRLPAALGRRFSSNGDMIFAGTLDSDVEVDLSHGPSITVGAFVNRPSSNHVITLQDLGFPPSLTSILEEVLPVATKLRYTGRGIGTYLEALSGRGHFRPEDFFSGSPVPRFLPYLGMGTDAGDGQLSLDDRGELRLDWDPTASLEMFSEMERAMQQMSAALGGKYVPSVLWRRPFRRLLTAHPLGGCVMSDSPDTGVVDTTGQVWGHPGLFVSDGAVIPGPLAVNPSLTIAAMAERIADRMVRAEGATA